MLLSMSAAAQAQSVEEIADQLAAKAQPTSPPCEHVLPDKTCADVPPSRQLMLGGAPAKAAARAVRSVQADINMTFLLGSAQLTDSAKATLDRFAAALKRRGTFAPFAVEGHTDSIGSREANRALSRDRAESVVSYLASRGIDRSKLTARGYGFDRPLPGRSASDPSNRRVEVVAR